ncbi:MAG: hypothetical protein HKN13_10725 [Rhodothermales bacterium]|nr:hypothetical protein [Rhodothermales bacterium]
MTISNDLPVPITIDQLEIQNIEAVGQYPAGHVVAQTSGQTIAPRGSQVVSLPLGQTGVAANVRTVAFASSPGSSSPTRIVASDAIRVDMSAQTEIEQILIRPTGESIDEGDRIAFDVPDISMPDASDYVELSGGRLEIEQLTNEIDISMNAVQISFPGIRTGAFAVQDSLVVTIPGGLPRSGSRTNVASVDLTDTRIYATGDELVYNISATSETAPDIRSISVTDRITGSVAVTGLVAREVFADVAPVDVNLGTDSNGDGLLDVMIDAEADVTQLGLDELSSAGISNPQLAGAEISFEISTDIAADFVLYGAIVGVSDDGSNTYLGGLGANVVSASESQDNPLLANGTPVSATDMIRLNVAGSNTVGKIVRRNLTLDESNSTITEFVGELPETIRFVGRAIVHPEGGKVRIREDFLLDAGLNVSIPVAIRESFNINKEVDADLSGLSDLSEPGSSVEVNRAELLLDYTNGMPLGVELRMQFVDEFGSTILTLPNTESAALSVGAGATDGNGFTTLESAGRTSIDVTADQLQSISRSSSIRLDMTANAGSSGLGRIRTDDKLELSLSGNFDVTINIGQ